MKNYVTKKFFCLYLCCMLLLFHFQEDFFGKSISIMDKITLKKIDFLTFCVNNWKKSSYLLCRKDLFWKQMILFFSNRATKLKWQCIKRTELCLLTTNHDLFICEIFGFSAQNNKKSIIETNKKHKNIMQLMFV